jgi:hypothetical protein
MPHIGFDLRQRDPPDIPGPMIKPFIENSNLGKVTANALSASLFLSGRFAWGRVVGIHPCSDQKSNCCAATGAMVHSRLHPTNLPLGMRLKPQSFDEPD